MICGAAAQAHGQGTLAGGAVGVDVAHVVDHQNGRDQQADAAPRRPGPFAAHAPRLLFVHWPFGHALGEPGRVEQQRTVLRDMLSLAQRAPRPGLVVDLPYRWRRESYPPIADWTSDGAAFAAALARALQAATPPVQ